TPLFQLAWESSCSTRLTGMGMGTFSRLAPFEFCLDHITRLLGGQRKPRLGFLGRHPLVAVGPGEFGDAVAQLVSHKPHVARHSAPVGRIRMPRGIVWPLDARTAGL